MPSVRDTERYEALTQDGGSQWLYQREDIHAHGQDSVGLMTRCVHLALAIVLSVVNQRCRIGFVEGAACTRVAVWFNSRKILIRHDSEDSP